MSSPLALIAGSGRFPFYVAQEARRQGRSVVAMGIQGWSDPSLVGVVDAYEEVPIGQLSRLIDRLKIHGAREAIMAGKVTKAVLLDPQATFDEELRGLLRRVGETSAPALLGAVARRLADAGITVLDSATFLQPQLCPPRVLTARAPTASEQADIQVGLRAAQALATHDIGQTVVVRERVVVAVEALEGTDAAVRRAHALAGDGLVVVKVASPQQDRRFDLPVIGMTTLEVLAGSGVSCLALEAGTTLLLERDALIAAADAAHLCVVGILPHGA
ncbi:MAG: UDP-2,3-diacylglucosamine diphosphatase LpxI [Candidatus Omnitrophota bacterium]|nr:UDP-2,3-diacylglucosamine diphosphatase LpxI [Candidatus Omnitrophota bacterium]